MVLADEKSMQYGLNPNLVSALAPFDLVEVGAKFGAELDNLATIYPCKQSWAALQAKLRWLRN